MPRYAFRHIITILAATLLVATVSCSSRRHTSRGQRAYSRLKDSPSVVFNGSGKKKSDPVTDKAAAPLDKKQADLVIAESRRWLGTPYRYGQSTKQKGTDCSGLVMEVYRKVLDIKLPRSSREQRQFCSAVGRNSLAPGDLVFFSSSGPKGTVNHVGIYIGSNSMIHASTSRGVIVSSLDERYFSSRFHSAGRIPGGRGSAAPAATNKSADKKDAKHATKKEPAKKEQTKNSDKSVSLDHLLEQAISSQVDSIFSSFMD
ncbi:MAG: C40 family peptidase [Muribaculaceae bacterium]|nr:C40 family peptidase [Muribaculaceae bacterium]